tara:strand:+ start:28 stop:396 length:369 start_codon:yes stop_codon:yes gene_type:complete
MENEVKTEILLKDLNDNSIDLDNHLGKYIEYNSIGIDNRGKQNIYNNVSLKSKKQDQQTRVDRITLIYIGIIILLICTILFTFLYLKTDYISTQNFVIFFIGILSIIFIMEFVFKDGFKLKL